MLTKTFEEFITARDKLLEEQKKEPLDIPTRQELEWIEKKIRAFPKEPRVSQDGLSREDKIKRIYEIVGEVVPDSCHYFPIMIGDVLDWLYTNKGGSYVLKIFPTLSIERIEMRKPIEQQCSDCIEYVYSLID